MNISLLIDMLQNISTPYPDAEVFYEFHKEPVNGISIRKNPKNKKIEVVLESHRYEDLNVE